MIHRLKYIEEFAKVIIILPLTLPSSSLAGYPPKQWLQQQKPHGSALGEMVGSRKWTCQEIHPVFSGTVGRNHWCWLHFKYIWVAFNRFNVYISSGMRPRDFNRGTGRRWACLLLFHRLRAKQPQYRMGSLKIIDSGCPLCFHKAIIRLIQVRTGVMHVQSQIYHC